MLGLCCIFDSIPVLKIKIHYSILTIKSIILLVYIWRCCAMYTCRSVSRFVQYIYMWKLRKIIWIGNILHISLRRNAIHVNHYRNSCRSQWIAFDTRWFIFCMGWVDCLRSRNRCYVFILFELIPPFYLIPCRDYRCHITHAPPPGQNDRHFADDMFRCIFGNDEFCILIKISLKFLPKGLIDNNPALA